MTDLTVQSYEYIYMNWVGSSPSGKTQLYTIYASRDSALLGNIKWHGAWRQYTFLPEPNTLFSAGCLADVQDFLSSLNASHRSKK